MVLRSPCSPTNQVRLPPLCRGQNKPLYALPQRHLWHSCPASIVPPRSGAKVVAPATKGGPRRSDKNAYDFFRTYPARFDVCIIFTAYCFGDWPPPAATPYPAAPDFPLCRGQNKPLYACLESHVAQLFSTHSLTAKRGGKRTRFVGERKRPENRVRRFPVEEGGAVRHQRGAAEVIRILMTFFGPILPALACVSFSLLTLQHPRATSWPSPPLWEASHVIFRSLTLPYKSRLLATSRGRKG